MSDLRSGLHSVYTSKSFATQYSLALGTRHRLKLEEASVWGSLIFLPGSSHSDYDGLKGFVRDRREAGIPIQRLFIVRHPDASIDAEAMEGVRKYVHVRRGTITGYTSRVAMTRGIIIPNYHGLCNTNEC